MDGIYAEPIEFILNLTSKTNQQKVASYYFIVSYLCRIKKLTTQFFKN